MIGNQKIVARRSRGFTLVETLVAITVLTLAIVGPFSAVKSALTASFTARDQLVAASLAQEAIEYIRSIRDNNYLNNDRPWMDGADSYACYGDSPTQYCMVDPTQGDVHTDNPQDSAMKAYATAGAVPVLYLSSANLYNQQNSGTPTKFRRYIQIHRINNNGDTTTTVRVTATVEWITATIPYSVTVTEYLRDWI